jgi:nucleoside-diphosphate-sugar epimerase/predicted dehydrogenase
MLREQRLDSVHVLVPPDLHYSLTKLALQSGVHVFLEKPMCLSVDEADDLLDAALRAGLRIGVNHNFLFSGAYQRLREVARSGELGRLDYVNFNHFYELAQIRSGPFESWMLRAPQNPFLEIGPHLVSAAFDLVGTADTFEVTADRNTKLPNGINVPRRWRIRTEIGSTAVNINVNLGPGFNQRTIYAHGLLGSAVLDFDANSCIIDRRTPLSTDLDRYRRSRSLAQQLRTQARATLADYVLSKLKLRKRGNPYQSSIIDSVAAFYSTLGTDRPLDTRIDGAFGRKVIEGCTNIARAANIEPPVTPGPSRRPTLAVRPTVLVLGGSGFIGRELIRQLLVSGYVVRAMMRGSGAVLEGLDNGHLEIFRGDLRNEVDVEAAMQGIEFVYHLATLESKTWDEGLRNIVEPTGAIGKACLAAGVKRLIYTGTISSYYTGAKAGTINEQTPLDPDISRRDYYSRAKAASEAVLMEMHRTQRLPVVIFRPGIVIGRGGIPFHWGVGRFSESTCEVWGNGQNKLPFVLVSDVATALVRGIQVSGIEGRSYNLVDVPLLTARDYLTELQRLAGIILSVHYRPIWRFYVSDLAKWGIKLAIRHPDRFRIPSYRDWESRTQRAFFDCERARTELGWIPASDRQRMIDEGIGGSLEAWLAATR